MLVFHWADRRPRSGGVGVSLGTLKASEWQCWCFIGHTEGLGVAVLVFHCAHEGLSGVVGNFINSPKILETNRQCNSPGNILVLVC